VLIDGPAVLARASPHGILDDHLFHDGQHTNLVGTIALAENVLNELQLRRAFGWPQGVTAPRIELKDCARHFELDARKWAAICDRSALFHVRTAYCRHDPRERLQRADLYERAAHDTDAGRPIQDAGLPSLAITNSLLFSGGQAPPGPDRRLDRPASEMDLDELVAAYNRVRADAKLPALKSNTQLAKAAREHAQDMAEHQMLSHQGSDGSDATKRVKRAGYHYRDVGENVASGQDSIEDVMTSWMNSPPHRENILGDFTEMGAAFALDKTEKRYWCVNLGRPWPAIDPDKATASVVVELNRARRAGKRSAVRADPALNRMAQAFVLDLARRHKVDTRNRDGESALEVLKRLKYPATRTAFSAASGEGDAAAVVKTWLARDEERKELFGPFDRIGVGVTADDEGIPYWVIVLAQTAHGRR
jgi:uncharacterized protein YkwD